MISILAKKMKDFVSSNTADNSHAIFLVGSGRKTENNLRDSIKLHLERYSYGNIIDVYYPESIFTELIEGPAKYDLLSLENLLAQSVHVVVIILESAGAIAELGAFSNHKELRNRLVVVVDEKYKKEKTFIMLGPVRYLKKCTCSSIIYHDFKKHDILSLFSLCEKIRKGIRSISSDLKLDQSIINPIMARHFLLFAIHVMEPIGMEGLRQVMKSAVMETAIDLDVNLRTTMNILLGNKYIELSNYLYKLTDKGLSNIRKIYRGLVLNKQIDQLRIEYINSILRKRKVKEWGLQTQIS